jgi:hypothetical protein
LALKLLFPAPKQERGCSCHQKNNEIMRNLVIGLGALVFVAGVGLWCGNVFGFFRTFPFAGYLTLIAGAAIFKGGQKMA